VRSGSIELDLITWAFNAFIRFASGEAIPLWLFPPLLGAVAAALPFQAIFFMPLSIYIGVHGGGPGRALAAQALWTAGVLLFCQVVWWRCQRRIVVQGG
jgi:ABC-2 type transport system permease protein